MRERIENKETKRLNVKWMKPNKAEGDCRLLILSEMLKYYNLHATPMDILGFGTGLSFQMTEFELNNNLILMSMMGRDMETEKNFCEKNRIKYEEKFSNEDYDTDEFDNEIIQSIYNDNPVVLSLDRYYLDFLTIPKAHYGYHVVMIIGYDLNNQTLDIIDVLSEKIETVHFNVIKKAMYKKLSYASPNGFWYRLSGENREGINKSKETFLKALRKQAQSMLTTDGAIEQMNVLSKFLLKTCKKAKYKKNNMVFIEYQIPFLLASFREQEGSGTFYRKLYYDFIKYYCNLYNLNYVYEEIENLIKEDIELWLHIAYQIERESSNGINQAYSFVNDLNRIAFLEKELFKRILESTINKN